MYEAVVGNPQQAPVAANNLAWLYAESGGNLDIALQLAQAAKRQMQNSSEVDDTLGWVYYKKQVSTLAIRSLKRAVDIDGRNPVHQYHLGMAYAADGQDKMARKTLQTALGLSKDFEGADEARRVMGTLLY